MSNLTTEEMREVSEVFKDSVDFVIGNQTKETAQELKLFMAGLVMREKPYLLLTQEGIERAMELVWAHANIADFVMATSYVFFARWGHDNDKVQGLFENLARGCALVDDRKELREMNATPIVVRDRLSDIGVTRRLIESNKWLVIVLLVQLFVTVAPAAAVK